MLPRRDATDAPTVEAEDEGGTNAELEVVDRLEDDDEAIDGRFARNNT